MQKNKILIVEPDQVSAGVLKLYLEQHDFQVCKIIEDAKSGIEAAKEHRPDLLLTEVSTRREGDGIEAAGIITRVLDIPVVFSSKYYSEVLLRRMQAVSPAGFLSKPLREVDLRATLFLALHSRDVMQRKPPKKSQPGPYPMAQEALRKIYKLTGAEANIVANIVQNPEVEKVAAALCISLSTVRTHLRNIFSKTGTTNQATLLHKIFTGPIAMYLDPGQRWGKSSS